MKSPRKLLKQYTLIAVSCFVYALSFNWCYVPNGIAFGGLTGIGQILHYLCPPIPVGSVVILLNIPLFLLGWKLLGAHFLLSSLTAMALSSLWIDVLAALHTFAPMEPILGAVCGGVLLGASLGIIFLQGATTGGTDLIARLLKIRLAWLPVGQLLLLTDLTVILAAAVIFRSMESALYGLIGLYLSTAVMDKVLYGVNNAKTAYIISDRPQEIADAVLHRLNRGVTFLHGEGAYSGTEKKVLLCAFRQREIVAVKEVVQETDPNAFMIVCAAHEVLGEGFGNYRGEGL